MGSDVDPVEGESVVLASFEDRRDAERLVASLGRVLRKQARRAEVAAFVVSGNEDGSLKLTQSRVLTAGDFASAVLRVFAAWMVGLRGMLSGMKGASRMGHAVRTHEGRVGSDEQAAHALLGQVGRKAALVLVCCPDRQSRQDVAAKAADLAIDSWDGSRTEFLGALAPGSEHDWVRDALGVRR